MRFCFSYNHYKTPKVAPGTPLSALRSRQEFQHLEHKRLCFHTIHLFFPKNWVLLNSYEKEILLTVKLLVSSELVTIELVIYH